MINNYLRKVDSRNLRIRKIIEHWNKNGFEFKHKQLQGDMLYKFVSDTGWECILDLNAWFANSVPASASMASSSWTERQLELLFTNAEKPLSGLPKDLEHHSFESIGIPHDLDYQSNYYSIMIPQGRMWLTSLNDKFEEIIDKSDFLNVGNIPVYLVLCQGYSCLSLAQLRKLSTGDVLFIEKQEYYVKSFDCQISNFVYVDGGIMLDINNKDEQMALDDIDENSCKLVAMDNINIKLEFVLQRMLVTISELEQLYLGQVLPCELNGHKNITIMANGVSIARGEIVWVDDRIGIEILDINQEVANAAKQ